MKLFMMTALMVLPPAIHAGEVWSTIGEHVRNRPDTSRIWGGPERLSFTELDYSGNHPFERRKLQESAEVDYDSTASSGDIRIKFLTDHLETLRGQNDDIDSTIDIIITETLPQIRQTWTNHLKVFPASGPIPTTQDLCIGPDGGIPDLVDEVEDADLVVIVAGLETIPDEDGNIVPLCGGGFLAVAGPCVLDQFDRPIVGVMNLCLQNVLDGGALPLLTTTAIHEMGHVLGISGGLFPYFRSPETGEPLTPRPLLARDVPCVDGSTQNIVFPAENTLQLDQTSRGELHYNIVTPRVQQVIRNHYNCPTLNGARLETQPTIPSCSGQHLDERTLYNELMTPLIGSELNLLSPITLAILEDSGWYQVDYEGAPFSSFGFGSGCAFVQDDCIIDNQVPSYATGDFCDTLTDINAIFGQILCDPGSVSFAICDLFDRDVPETDPFFVGVGTRFFTNHPSWEASQPQFDGCPIPSISAANNCLDPESVAIPSRYDGEVYGSTSRCINVQASANSAYPGCFEVVCNADTRRAIVNGFECTYDFEPFSVSQVFDNITSTAQCPKLSTVCPQFFCQGGCSGRGVCNFETNQCECTDPTNSSPICALSGTSNPPPTTSIPVMIPTSTAPSAPTTATTPAPNTQPTPDVVAPTVQAMPTPTDAEQAMPTPTDGEQTMPTPPGGAVPVPSAAFAVSSFFGLAAVMLVAPLHFVV